MQLEMVEKSEITSGDLPEERVKDGENTPYCSKV